MRIKSLTIKQLNPEKNQIVPYNLTKEIIEETSVLYREEPIYTVKDADGNELPEATKLWAKIRKESRYHNLCQQLDAMTKLLGTVLVKVTFVDPDTGDLVNENKPGRVNFELVLGGSYDVKYMTSPYYLNEVDFSFSAETSTNVRGTVSGVVPLNKDLSVAMKPGTLNEQRQARRVNSIQELNQSKITKIMWNKDSHRVEDSSGNYYEGENPYGCIPAVPFFNQDPGNLFFLPVNEPLLYANHAVNMRLTDLNHVVKYQSFGQAVVKGIERPVNNRLGRPIDDMNARGGSRGGFGFGRDISPTGLDRNNFNPFDFYGDGNAQANMNGFSMGPDTLISVGETGDFKFENPKADIAGLTSTIYTMMDMVRINHGLQPKHNSKLPPSGFALMSAKLGVVEQNKRRQILFREREQQLFQIVKKLWNTHHESEGEELAELFPDDAQLEVYYVDPEFVVDPQTKVLNLKGEQEILNTGNKTLIKKLYPHLDDKGLDKLIEEHHKQRVEQAERDAQVEVTKGKILMKAGLQPSAESDSKPEKETKAPKPRITNRAKHAEESSVQPGKNGDSRETNKKVRVRKQKQLEAGFKEE